MALAWTQGSETNAWVTSPHSMNQVTVSSTLFLFVRHVASLLKECYNKQILVASQRRPAKRVADILGVIRVGVGLHQGKLLVIKNEVKLDGQDTANYHGGNHEEAHSDQQSNTSESEQQTTRNTPMEVIREWENEAD